MLLIVSGVLTGQPLDTMFVLEISPGTERATDLIRPDVLGEDDRAGVIGFFKRAYVLQPLTDNRDDLAAALRQGGLRVGAAVGRPSGRQMESNFTIDIVEALKKACVELRRRDATERQRAIIVFFAGDDPNLSTQLDIVATALATANTRLYAIVIPRVGPPDVANSGQIGTPPFPFPSPLMSTKLISQLAEKSGGQIFRRNWNLTEILERARRP